MKFVILALAATSLVTAVSEVGVNGDQLEEFSSPPFAPIPIANAVQYDSKAFITKMLNRLERVEDSIVAPFTMSPMFLPTAASHSAELVNKIIDEALANASDNGSNPPSPPPPGSEPHGLEHPGLPGRSHGGPGGRHGKWKPTLLQRVAHHFGYSLRKIRGGGCRGRRPDRPPGGQRPASLRMILGSAELNYGPEGIPRFSFREIMPDGSQFNSFYVHHFAGARPPPPNPEQARFILFAFIQTVLLGSLGFSIARRIRQGLRASREGAVRLEAGDDKVASIEEEVDREKN